MSSSFVDDNGWVSTQVEGGRLRERKAAPSLGLMHYALLLSGLGTALLGPILPQLATQWHMRDSDSGLLMMAKFCGAFLGGVSVSRKLRRSLLVGFAAGAVGFGCFAFAPSMAIGCAGLFVGGFGLGRMITSTNILAGRRFTAHRGAALSLLNFSFSLGAMLSALLAAWLLPLFRLHWLMVCFAALFVVGGAGLLLEMTGSTWEEDSAQPVEKPKEGGVSERIYLYFAALLFFYGGLETCLSGWLTTFALRYGQKTLVVSEYTTLLLWMSLTFGRVVASALMLRVGERTVQRAGLVLSAMFTAALAVSHSAVWIAAFAVLLGLSLAPFFPATWALLMAERPSARQAGIVLAVSGLGAAAFPWLMGVVSTATGSLQIALGLPLATALVLLGLSMLSPRTKVMD
jgi:MFS transporter, FHS family, glucose/mannose:H+ symporter